MTVSRGFKLKPTDEPINKVKEERLLSEDFNQELKPIKMNYLYKAMMAKAPESEWTT